MSGVSHVARPGSAFQRRASLWYVPTDGHELEGFEDNSVTATGVARVEAIFQDHAARLVREIRRAPCVVGCVAWLTHPDVLDALAWPEVASIVAQKEDFLRPDGDTKWAEVRARYERIGKRNPERHIFDSLIGALSVACDPTLQGVRCAGPRQASRSRVEPRMHNKFFVFAGTEYSTAGLDLYPYAVWTGSYNPTLNAERSLENALLIHDETIAESYLREWEQIVALSEPLDWRHEWIDPQWRIGT